MKYNKIAFIGMMGCGKSTISKLLSEKINLRLYDLDEIFEIENNIKIKDFFEKYGENTFRKKESELLEKVTIKNEFIISCGGGIILEEKNRKILFGNDILTIYLKTTEDELFVRLKNDNKRPLLQKENPKDEIKKILSARKKFYKQAKLTIETTNKTPKEITEEIWKKLQ